jgi:hypothetical protein
LDLYLMHWPVTGNTGPEVLPPLAGTWAAMEALVSPTGDLSVRLMEANWRQMVGGRHTVGGTGRAVALPGTDGLRLR